MSRYIDAEKLINRINAYVINSQDVMFIRKLIKDLETEDVAPVVHAHWIEFEDYSGAVYPECSRCGLVWWLDEGTAEDNEMYYCPKCGAKMDEEVDNA